jgi:putative lipoprotein
MKTEFKLFSAATILLVFGLAACSASGQTAADPLESTSWELVSFGGTPVMEGTTVTASFADGQVTGEGGCNSYGGSYQVDGENIEFNEVVMTMMACMEPEGVMDQETAVMAYLNDAQTFEIDADGQLHIYRADGEGLVFAPGE